MKLAKLADACLYLMAGSVIFAVTAAFINQMSEGATAEEYTKHYENVSEPIILTASEAAEAHLVAANKPVRSAVKSCVDGACDTAKSVKENKPVRSFGKRIRQFFARWRS